MDLYAENILNHYRHPRHKKPATRHPPFDSVHSRQPETIVHTEANLSCGDEISISLNIKDDRITEIFWDGTGCAISQAAMSMLSEELHGKTMTEIEALTPQNIYDSLGVPIGPRRAKCALLGLLTLKNTLRTHKGVDHVSWARLIALHNH